MTTVAYGRAESYMMAVRGYGDESTADCLNFM